MGELAALRSALQARRLAALELKAGAGTKPALPPEIPPTGRPANAGGLAGPDGPIDHGALREVNLTSGAKGNWNAELNKPSPNTIYNVDSNKTYQTDSLGRWRRSKRTCPKSRTIETDISSASRQVRIFGR